MRLATAFVLVLVFVSGAVADRRIDDLVADTRDATETVRRAASTQLAADVAKKSAGAREAALIAVLSDDPVVRERVVAALVGAGAVDTASAARIPTLAALGKQIPTFVTGYAPPATSCRVTAADPRAATIACHAQRCRTCTLETSDLELRAGTQWTVVSQQQRRRPDDERCGFCE